MWYLLMHLNFPNQLYHDNAMDFESQSQLTPNNNGRHYVFANLFKFQVLRLRNFYNLPFQKFTWEELIIIFFI